MKAPRDREAIPSRRRTTRRDFLRTAGAVPAALAAAGALPAGAAPAEPAATPPAPEQDAPVAGMPRIRLGPHSVSRLVCGANPFNGGSHLSIFVNHEMKRYYTPERILATLRRCEEMGINTWQSSKGNYKLWRRYLDEGGKMQYLSIEAGDAETIRELKDAGCIGIAHHGEVSDNLFKSGRAEEIGDYVKRVKDAGLLAGVSTHMPAVVDLVESKGWEVDYYMTCVYERHRSKEELEKLLGQAPIPVGEVYLPLDPPRMFRAIQQTRRPCLAFKILAAGRLSGNRAWVEGAFRDTLASIKPSDGVIVGIYDRYEDQVADDAELVRRFSALSSS